jgi:hypothetical protein
MKILCGYKAPKKHKKESRTVSCTVFVGENTSTGVHLDNNKMSPEDGNTPLRDSDGDLQQTCSDLLWPERYNWSPISRPLFL